MKTQPITVLGSINVDLVVRGKQLPAPGETVTGGQFFQSSGGKGANKAVAAARATRLEHDNVPGENKQPVRLIGAVGDDAFGREVLTRLSSERLDCDHVRTLAGTATGIALILVDENGENMISVASGANAEVGVADINALPASVFEGVFVSNLELSLCTVARGLKRAKNEDATTILNPAPARESLLENNVLKLVDVLTPNEHEAATLTGLPVTNDEQAAAAARRLRELGVTSCVITRGALGCTVRSEEGLITHLAARQAEAVDTTAAGDAFNGALAVALAEGKSLLGAVEWATKAAAISVTRPGAQPSLPGRAEIEAAS